MVQTPYRHRRSRSARLPRPKGWLLAHGVAFISDEEGLYHFYIPPDDGWVRCRCGWRPELGPHYAHPAVACTDASLYNLKDKLY